MSTFLLGLAFGMVVRNITIAFDNDVNEGSPIGAWCVFVLFLSVGLCLKFTGAG